MGNSNTSAKDSSNRNSSKFRGKPRFVT